MLVGLIGMLALVLDGGNFYTQRSSAQVAADAGALAGAREFCETENSSAAENSAFEYAVTKNAADAADITFEVPQAMYPWKLASPLIRSSGEF